MTGYDLRMSREPLIYAPTDSKYKQLSQLFFAQDKLLINVSYVHALDLRLRPGEESEREINAVKDWAVEDLMQGGENRKIRGCGTLPVFIPMLIQI